MCNQEVKDFCEEHNLSINQFYGIKEFKGDLILSSVIEIPNNFNPIVIGSLDLSSVTEIPKGFNPIVGGCLYLKSVTKIPKGFSPKVDGSLYLDSVIEMPNGFSPIVGGNLYLKSVTKLPEGFSPKVGGTLNLRSLTELPEDFNPIIGRDLNLHSLTKIPRGFNPIVGGDLILSSATEISKGFNPIVGWGLYLNSINELPEGFNPKVGGDLFIKSIIELPEDFNPEVEGGVFYNNACKDINYKLPILSWENGKYISVDGIFCEVLHKRGNIFKCKYLHNRYEFYVVTDGNDTYAHGYNIKEAQADLLYKLAERNIDEYRNLSLDSVLVHDEAVICYRVITGACAFGTKNFLDNILGDNAKESYTISEIIQLTKNKYGNNTFKSFFNA